MRGTPKTNILTRYTFLRFIRHPSPFLVRESGACSVPCLVKMAVKFNECICLCLSFHSARLRCADHKGHVSRMRTILPQFFESRLQPQNPFALGDGISHSYSKWGRIMKI